MAVTDLTNTSWVINDSYSIPSTVSSSKEFYINFTIEGDLSFVGIDFWKSVTVGSTTYTDNIIYDNGSGTNPYVAINGGATWQDNSYKTVHISGGTDATNSSLISWFEANATKIFPLEYIDKVVLPSEEEYNIKDTISGYLKGSDLVAGTNISIEETSEGQLEISSSGSSTSARIIRMSIVERKYWVIEDPTFTSEMNKTWDVTIRPGWNSNAVFNSIKFDSSTGNISLEDGSYHTGYGDYDNVRYDLYANSAWNDVMEADVSGETQQFGVSSPEYIYILGGADDGDPDFVNWLLTHAVPVHPLLAGVSGSVTVPAGTELRLLGFNVIRYQEDTSFLFNFSSNSVDYTGIKYAYADGQSEYYYIKSSGNTYITNYYNIMMTNNSVPEYGFSNSAYRDLTITDQFTASASEYAILYNAVVVDSISSS